MRPLVGQLCLPFGDREPARRPVPLGANGKPGPPCLKCTATTIVSPGKGPHYLRVDCPDCGVSHWLPKPRTTGRSA
jgi:hypothetical protein